MSVAFAFLFFGVRRADDRAVPSTRTSSSAGVLFEGWCAGAVRAELSYWKGLESATLDCSRDTTRGALHDE